MTDNQLFVVCHACGAQCDPSAVRCESCGALINSEIKTEAVLITENAVEADTRTDDVFPENESAAYLPKEKSSGKISAQVFRSALIFAVAVLLMISALCPVVWSDVSVNSVVYTIDISPLDSINYAISSFYSKSNSAIMNTQLYEDIVGHFAHSHDVVNVMTHKEALNGIMVLSSMSKYNMFASVIFAGVASVVYILLCFVFLIKSGLSLLGALFPDVEFLKKNTEISILRWLWTMVLLSPMFIYTFLEAARFTEFELFGMKNLPSRGIFWYYAIALILALAVSVFLGIKYAKALGKPSKVSPLRKLAGVIISSVCAIIIAVSIFLPTMTASVATQTVDGVKEQSMQIPSSEFGEKTETQNEKYRNITMTAGNDEEENIYSVTQKAALRQTNMKGAAEFIFNGLFISYMNTQSSAIFVISTILKILILGTVALVLANSLNKALLGGEDGKKAKIFLAILAIAFFVLITVTAFMANGTLTSVLQRTLVFNLSIGPVLAVVGAVVMLITMRGYKRNTKDIEYDDADVAHAPYVMLHK